MAFAIRRPRLPAQGLVKCLATVVRAVFADRLIDLVGVDLDPPMNQQHQRHQGKREPGTSGGFVSEFKRQDKHGDSAATGAFVSLACGQISRYILPAPDSDRCSIQSVYGDTDHGKIREEKSDRQENPA